MNFAETLTRRAAEAGRHELFIEDVAVAALAEEHGTPLYVYSRSGLIERAQRLRRAFGTSPHLVAYSIKSNMNLAVAQTLIREAGCGVDVTSRGELERALLAGAQPQMLVYSGVGKRADEIDRALSVGLRMFNVESLDELALIDARGRASGCVAPISFRLNPDVDPLTHPKISTGLRSAKFGIPIEEARQAYAHAKTLSNVRSVGVDCHIGSQMLSLAPLRDALLKLKHSVLALREDGHSIELIDIGGGLGVQYSDDEEPPTQEAYAEIAAELVGGLEATIVCEPGRSLTAGAGMLISRVLYQKENSKKRFVIIDAGMNDYVRPAMYQSPVRIETASEADRNPVDIVGPVCETTDRFASDYPLPAVRNGDLIVFRDVGAYGFCMASTYNGRALAAEVMVDGSRAELVRRRQTLEETWSGERIPDWERAQ
jgi:diaminopimelate decarboxylase